MIIISLSIATIVGNVLIVIGILFIAFGMFGILRYRELFTRLLIAAKVDTVGFITVMLGAVIRTGWSMQTLKIFVVMLFVAITNPLVTHSIANSALSSGYKPQEKKQQDG